MFISEYSRIQIEQIEKVQHLLELNLEFKLF